VDLLQLRYFQAVARHQHVSRAADELRIAQPALSRSIARLEAELGVPLFDRHGRRVILNRFGAAFLRRAESALGELDQARRELDDAAGLARGSVAIATETLRTITDLIAGFVAEHPEVSFQLRQSPAPEMTAQLQAGQVDLCFTSQPLSGPALRSAKLLSEEVLLAVPRTHHLARRRRVKVETLAGEPVITTSPGYWQRTLTNQLFATAGIHPAVVCESNEPYAIRGLISAGVGVGLMPAIARQATSHPPVAWLHLDAAGCQRTLSVVWRQDTYLSIAARHFRDYAASRNLPWSPE
jgi:DNA-binding transcriptional LysR family regulator